MSHLAAADGGLARVAAYARNPSPQQLSTPDGIAGWLLQAPGEELGGAVEAIASQASSSAGGELDDKSIGALRILKELIAQQLSTGSLPPVAALQSMGPLRAPALCLPLLPTLLRMATASLSEGQPSDAVPFISALLLEQYNAIVLASRADPAMMSRERLPLPAMVPEDYGQSTLTPNALKNRAAWAVIGMIPQYPSPPNILNGDNVGPVAFVVMAVCSHLLYTRQQQKVLASAAPVGWTVFVKECAKLLLDDHVTSLCSRDDELAVVYSSVLYVLIRLVGDEERDGEWRTLVGELGGSHLTQWVELMLCYRSARSAHIALMIKGSL